MNRSLHLRSAKMFSLMNGMKCEMHIWLFDNRVYLFRLDFDWQNELVYLCLRYSRWMFLEWHPVRDLFVHVNKPSISFISFSGIIIWSTWECVCIQIYFSHDINVIILLQIIDQKMYICNTSFTIFAWADIAPFPLLWNMQCNYDDNTSQRNNYFLFATMSLINRI